MKMISEYNLLTETWILFKDMSVVAAILLGAGLLLCIIEIARPSLGLFFGLGAILLIIGIVVRITDNGSFQMLFILLFLLASVMVVTFLITVRTAKYSWLLREQAIDDTFYNSEYYRTDDNSENENPDSKEYYFLLNHEGVTLSKLAPSGTIVINDIEFDAIAHGKIAIPVDTPVRVVEVENNKIIVKPV